MKITLVLTDEEKEVCEAVGIDFELWLNRQAAKKYLSVEQTAKAKLSETVTYEEIKTLNQSKIER